MCLVNHVTDEGQSYSPYLNLPKRDIYGLVECSVKMDTNRDVTFLQRVKFSILAVIQMPRMHSSSTQCCLCVIGVFMFLVGIIMFATGVCLILNYGYFDLSLLPTELQNDDGKRTVGIILTVVGLLCVIVSVISSSVYLCSKNKPQVVTPNELDKIPTSSRKGSAGSRTKTGKVRDTQSPATRAKTNTVNKSSTTNNSMHSSVVPPNRHKHKHRKGGRSKRKIFQQKSRLEGIEELDAVSRKLSEKDVGLEEFTEGNDMYDKNEHDRFSAPHIKVSHHDTDIDKAAFDGECSSTSSGFMGSEKTDSLSREDCTIGKPVVEL